jgi:hypothetical protein
MAQGYLMAVWRMIRMVDLLGNPPTNGALKSGSAATVQKT